MDNTLLQYFISQGAFAALFVYLLLDTRKDAKQRDKEYQETIKENQAIICSMTENFSIVKEIKSDVDDIKEKIFK